MTEPYFEAAPIRKNASEVVRVTVEEFNGYNIVNVRVWFTGDDGQPKPGRQGVAVRVELLPDVIAALTRARDAAIGARLLTADRRAA